MPAIRDKKDLPREIKDRDALTDRIHDWVFNNAPSLSVDALMCRPLDAMRMGVEVGVHHGRMSARQGRRIMRALDAMVKCAGKEIDVIDEICRAAMSARKRGNFSGK